MNMKKNNYLLAGYLLITSALLDSCVNNNSNKISDIIATDTAAVVVSDSVQSLTNEKIADIIQSIPSPAEISAVIKATEISYNAALLNTTENMDRYSTNSRKAFAIGVFGGDLGYINIYEKTYSSINYLNVIKNLAVDLKVGQFFDFNTIKRLAKSNKDIDSLIQLSTSNFNDMDNYLREQHRENLSALMATGAWLECLYLQTQAVKEKPNEELMERIAEQKITLQNLILVLNVYKSDVYCAEVAKELLALEQAYSGVTLSSEFAQSEAKEVNGELVVTDNSKSEVNITEAQLQEITSLVLSIRNKTIN